MEEKDSSQFFSEEVLVFVAVLVSGFAVGALVAVTFDVFVAEAGWVAVASGV